MKVLGFLLFHLQWVEAVLGEPLPAGDFGEVLKDGVILCKLINKIQPGSVKKFKEKVTTTTTSGAKVIQNIYLIFCPTGSSIHVDGECPVIYPGRQEVRST